MRISSSVICNQVMPLMTPLTASVETFSNLAIFLFPKPNSLFNLLISITFSLVNTALFEASPFTCLPFTNMSFTLSFGDPRNRCFGLTHFGLSHLWQTNTGEPLIDLGMSPFAITQETLLACSPDLLTANCPYLHLPCNGIHSQQSSSPSALFTFSQNLRISF